ncbi:hypothetical protein HZS_7812, partial [Henneguya salminicola]
MNNMNINQSEILSSILKRIRICSNFGNALSEIDAVEKLLDDNKVSKEELLEFLLNVKNIWPKSNEVLKACNNIQKKIIEISKKYLKNHTDEIWKNQCMGIAQISNLPADCENWYKAYKQLKLKKRPNINNIRNKIVKKNEKIVQSKTKNVSISAGNPKKNIKFNYLSNKNNTSLSKTKPQLSTGMKKTIQMFKTE